MKLTESLLDELINQVIKEEEPEKDKKKAPAPPEDKETDFQELPIDIPEDPFKPKSEGHTINFSKDEMAKLHKDGQIEKDGHNYVYQEGTIKLKKLLSENFWNQVAQMKGWEAPPKERRWSKSMNDGLGHLTEFEANKGGVDYIKEVGAGPLYRKYIKSIDKQRDQVGKETLKFYDLLRKKGLDDAADDLLDSYKNNVINFGKDLKQIARKLM